MNITLRFIFALLFILNAAFFFVIKDKKDAPITSVESHEAGKNLAKIKAFSDSLPDDKEIVALVSRLTKLGTKLNLKIPGVHYAPLKTDPNGYKNLVITFSVTGNYSDMRKFIYELENMGKLMYIESLTMRKNSSDKESMNIDLQVTTYFK